VRRIAGHAALCFPGLRQGAAFPAPRAPVLACGGIAFRTAEDSVALGAAAWALPHSGTLTGAAPPAARCRLPTRGGRRIAAAANAAPGPRTDAAPGPRTTRRIPASEGAARPARRPLPASKERGFPARGGRCIAAAENAAPGPADGRRIRPADGAPHSGLGRRRAPGPKAASSLQRTPLSSTQRTPHRGSGERRSRAAEDAVCRPRPDAVSRALAGRRIPARGWTPLPGRGMGAAFRAADWCRSPGPQGAVFQHAEDDAWRPPEDAAFRRAENAVSQRGERRFPSSELAAFLAHAGARQNRALSMWPGSTRGQRDIAPIEAVTLPTCLGQPTSRP
jgi:hypothetical protein